jgi:hypothetical protein
MAAYSIGRSKRCKYPKFNCVLDSDLAKNASFVATGPGTYDAPLVHKKSEPKWS